MCISTIGKSIWFFYLICQSIKISLWFTQVPEKFFYNVSMYNKYIWQIFELNVSFIILYYEKIINVLNVDVQNKKYRALL